MTSNNLLNPGDSISVPDLADGTVLKILEEKFGKKISRSVRMNSYDDQNYRIWVVDPVTSNEDSSTSFVLKITNSRDSQNGQLFDAQAALLEHLWSAGFNVPHSIPNTDGKLWSTERLQYNTARGGKEISGIHGVRLFTYIPGDLLASAEMTPNLMYQVGQYLGKLHTALETFHHPFYDTHLHSWMLQQLSQVSAFDYCLKEDWQKAIVKSVIESFESAVLSNAHNLPTGQLHGDFNEQNILVDGSSNGSTKVVGLLDVGDSAQGCLIYDLAITIMYVLIVLGTESTSTKTTKDINANSIPANDANGDIGNNNSSAKNDIASENKNPAQSRYRSAVQAGGHVIAGYLSAHSLSELEFRLLRPCVAARFIQSVVFGLYSYSLTPENEYLLATQPAGWGLLKCLWTEVPESELISQWRAIIAHYGIESLDHRI